METAVPYEERPKDNARIEPQELWCHDCRNYVQFIIDVSLDGNHVLECPECGHEHCRVVRNGEITDIRWDQRNGDSYRVSPQFVTTSSASTINYTADSGTYFLAGSWASSSTSTTGNY